ncbi:MAG: hypothetical protein ACK49F_02035 [Bacteroidota bacterium]
MIQNYLQEIFPKTSNDPFFGGNYAYSSWMFESGFPGFPGLTITSLVWVGWLLLHVAFNTMPFADVLHIGEKKGKK